MRKRTVFITGYPYVRDAYRKTFDALPNDDMSVRFILPRSWPIKKGTVVFTPEPNDKTDLVTALFSHSHYPLIGGLLKGWMPVMPWVLARRARRGDVLFTALEPTLKSALYNGFWAKIFGLKHVLFTWENIPYEEKHHGVALRFKQFMVKLNRWFSDAIICGNQDADSIMKKLGFKNRATIPLSGIDTIRFSRGTRPTEYRGVDLQNKSTLAFAGAIDDRKGLPYVIDALKVLVSDGVAIHMFIAGAGPMQHDLQERVSHSVLEGKVTFLPWLSPDELAELLSATDIFVHPSTTRRGWAEQFGYVVAEALATGTPAVVSTSGALPWIVKDGLTGRVVAERDSAALARVIGELCNSASLRERMGVAASADAQERFSYESVAAQYQTFFSSMI